MDTSPQATDELEPTANGFEPSVEEPSAAELSRAFDVVKNFVDHCEPDLYTGEDAAKMVVVFAKAKRSLVAGELLSPVVSKRPVITNNRATSRSEAGSAVSPGNLSDKQLRRWRPPG